MRLVGLIVLVAGAFLAGRYLQETPEPRVRYVNRPLLPTDLRFNPWDQLDAYLPDTVRVREECLQVPAHLVEPEPAGSPDVPAPERKASTLGQDTPETLAPLLGPLSRRYWFLLLPLSPAGEPAVTVHRHSTTVQAYDPETLRGLAFTYDHPRPTWSLAPELGLAFPLGASLRLVLEHRSRLALGLGYSVVDQAPELTLRYQPFRLTF